MSRVRATLIPLPNKKYQLIVADPAWFYKKSGGIKSARGLCTKYYPVMTTEEIKSIPVNKIADKNCYLFLWATAPVLPEAIEVLKSWGFEYFTVVFTWIKTNKKSDSLFWGMGNSSRANPEFVLLGRKGKIQRLDAGVHSVIERDEDIDPDEYIEIIKSKIQYHSKKPKEVIERIRNLYGNLDMLEMFARETSENHDTWGNEVPLLNQ